MKLNDHSLKKLEGIHPDLRKVVLRAAEHTPIDFIVTEGVRSIAYSGSCRATIPAHGRPGFRLMPGQDSGDAGPAFPQGFYTGGIALRV